MIPTDLMVGTTTIDPWKVERKTQFRLVKMFDRNSEPRVEIPFNAEHPTAVGYADKLILINDLNSRFKIKAHVASLYDKNRTVERQLRPMVYARFTNDFDHHGRLYTGHEGHQGLNRIERDTIRFGRFPSVELDFSGMHIRMLYHQAGIDYVDDPYALWGDKTTDAARTLVKKLTNALINASSSLAAVSSSNYSTMQRDNGVWKTGKSLRDAQMLDNALKKTGLTFKGLVPLVYSRHAKIADQFGTDAGLRLMNIDGRIALEVTHDMVMEGVPCLPCHDSFRVPRAHRRMLRRFMHHHYHSLLGHYPLIK